MILKNSFGAVLFFLGVKKNNQFETKLFKKHVLTREEMLSSSTQDPNLVKIDASNFIIYLIYLVNTYGLLHISKINLHSQLLSNIVLNKSTKKNAFGRFPNPCIDLSEQNITFLLFTSNDT